MLRSIRHRGPDSLGGFVDDRAAIGSARLSIVDLPGGSQPAVSEDHQVAVVFNGEIFNYLELRRDMESAGIRFHSRSEVETLLQLYLAHGEQMLDRLNGQFALAIWDRRRPRLILARDRFGIRPLFWTRRGDGLVFASEVKALSALGDIDLKLDPSAIIQSFRFWTCIGDTSPFQGVHQIPPAHYLDFSAGASRLVRYWDWPFPGDAPPLRMRSDADYCDAFRQQLRDAVQRQRMADIEVGSYLSGGIDSSAVVQTLQDLMGQQRLQAYSIAFDDPDYDESAAQAAVAAHCGLRHHSVRVAAADIGAAFPQVVWHAEAPLFRTAPAPLFLLSRRVHADGIKVVMTGEGADEILLGYDLFREVRIRRFWGRQPDSRLRGELFRRLYHYLPQFRNPRYFALARDFYRPFLVDDGSPHYAMATRWANGMALETYFSPEMAAHSASHDPLDQLQPWLGDGYATADDIARAQRIEMLTLLPNYLLSSQGDRMSMAHAVEGRYPYLDNEFVDFAARLPRGIKLRGLKEKFVLRRAFADSLPNGIAQRPKVAYQAPEMKAFFENGRPLDYVADLLRPGRLAETGWFAPDRVANLLARGQKGGDLRGSTRDNMAFVLILSVQLLDELFVRQRLRPQAQVGDRRSLALV